VADYASQISQGAIQEYQQANTQQQRKIILRLQNDLMDKYDISLAEAQQLIQQGLR